MNPVLVAAARFEVDPLNNALQALGFAPEICLTGVGALNAAKRARAIAEACRGKNVIFIGTCGTFGAYSRLSLVRAREILWSPTCERMHLSYTVKDSAPPIALPDPMARLRDLPARRVLCSPSISLVSKLPDGYIADDCVENLELYSCIGDIAAQAGTISVVLAVTNSVGPDAHQQWRQNFGEAAGKTAEYISSRMTKGEM